MNIEELKLIRFIKLQIKSLEEQISNLDADVVTDKVSGSMHDFPYSATNFKIEGIDIDDYNRKVKKLRKRLIEKKDKLIDLQQEADEFLDSIKDVHTRTIIQLRYVEGCSWNEIAQKIGGNNTADGVRMSAKRFLRKM